MSANQHRIGRVVFEIGGGNRAAFEDFAGTVRANFSAVIERALEIALDRVDRPSEVVRLGRVEIDLGRLDGTGLAVEELARRITDGIADRLPAVPAGEARDRAAIGGDIAELARFLETGELPWSEGERTLAALAAVFMALDRREIAAMVTRLRPVLSRPRAAERLVRQFPAVLVRRILLALVPESIASDVITAAGEGRTVALPSDAPAADVLVFPLSEVVRGLARGSSGIRADEILALVSALDGDTASVPSLPETLPPAAPGVRELDAEAPAREGAPQEAGEPESAGQSALRPVHAAGAVLLHPFLGAFFDRLGLLVAPDRFRDAGARSRAVLLVHFLATGAEEVAEPDTVLGKLLCGMPPAEPVPRRVGLSERERAESDALLRSVIAHWTRLGNVSPDGLREGFLSRRGYLDEPDGQWRLTLERHGIDVLLDGLPWTLSRVQTAFMTAPLIVVWR